jgi:DNA-binding protein H-NS
MGHYFTTPFAWFNTGATIKSLGTDMKQTEIKSLSIDELWTLHEAIAATLAEKIAVEKKLLEERLRLLANGQVEHTGKPSKHRRPYPPVLPKFRNPDEPSETWAGRGKQPRWVRKQLRSGKRMDDLRIESLAA